MVSVYVLVAIVKKRLSLSAKPIQEMIETQLPKGSTTDRVTTFLSVRGYEMQNPEKPGTMVAVIRHIDTQTVRPVTARVTFYFDAEWQTQLRGDDPHTESAHRVTLRKILRPFRARATFRASL